MTGISHKQTRRFLHAAADGLIREDQRILLNTHLLECNTCRVEAEELSIFEARLKKRFQAQWNEHDGPSGNVMKSIYSRSRRITMSRRINIGLRAVASVIALILLGLSLNYLFLNLKRQPYGSATSFNTGAQSGELITFVSDQNGNKEIYVMKSDGSGKINLTQNPAMDDYPIWSPDGAQIAFVSNRNGNENIYIMDEDGSNLTRLTNAIAADNLFVWSPDGKKIAYSSRTTDPKNANIYVVNVKTRQIDQVTNYASNITVWPSLWSSDSRFIFFQLDRQMIKVEVNGGAPIPFTPKTDKEAPLIGVLSKDSSTFFYLTICDEISSTRFCYSLHSIEVDGANHEILGTLETPDLCKVNQTEIGMGGSWARWSPDRTKILFVFTCDEKGWLYMANGDGTDFKLLTSDPIIGNNIPQNEFGSGDWSSDSQSIVFTLGLDQPRKVYTLNIDDALKNSATGPTLITNVSNSISSLSWQPKP